MQTKLNISAIKELCNSNPDCFFFSKDTMRFYRHAHAKYSVKYIGGLNYVVVTYNPPETRIIREAYYLLRETKGRYDLQYISALPEKQPLIDKVLEKVDMQQ